MNDETSPLRVCHVISADLWAGAAVQAYQTVSDLRKRDIDVSVAVFNDGVFARRMESEKFRWKLFDERRLTAFRIARGLADFIKETDPHCLHVHAHKEHILGAFASALAKRRSMPLVRTIHGTGHVTSGLQPATPLKKRGIRALEQLLLRRAVLIAVSEQIEQLLRRTYPSARVQLVRNGVRDADITQSRDEIRRRWGVPEDAFWVGCVARLEPVKNLPCLVRAAAALGRTVPELRVSIFGTGSQRVALQDLIGKLGAAGIVTLHGFEEDMPTTASAFDCFALSSFDEGMPMSLLEAMALGVPPVCSAVGGVRELIHDGETGLLFESDDEAGLAAALTQVFASKDLARRMGHAARQFVKQSFAIEVTNAALVEVYRSLMPVRGAMAATGEPLA